MSSLVINTQYVTISQTGNQRHLDKGFEGSFKISSALERLGITEGDPLVIAQPEDSDLRFISQGFISKVDRIEKIKPSQETVLKSQLEGKPIPKEKFEHNFYLNINNSLTENNLLSDLEYSLKTVYSYNKPIVHFQKQFRDLNHDDFNTIINGWVYTARTVFGKLINAIPRQNKLEFMLQAMDHFSTIDFSKVPLSTGLDFLYDYIDKRILSRGRLLVQTDKLIKENLSDILPPSEIGFIDPYSGKSNYLSKQADIFNQIFVLEKKSDLRKVVNQNISENSELEYRFLQIFNKETWPIDLH